MPVFAAAARAMIARSLSLESAAIVAELLARIFPVPRRRASFVLNSGTDIVDMPPNERAAIVWCAL